MPVIVSGAPIPAFAEWPDSSENMGRVIPEDDPMLYYDDVRSGIIMDLRECLLVGLEMNYDIIMEKNRQDISDNNATRGNAGSFPTVSGSAGYSGTLNNTRQELSAGGTNKNNGVHNYSVNAGIDVGWTFFDGFRVRTTYNRLMELKTIGELNTRLTIEEFITDFTVAYYNYIRQYRRLRNLHSAVSLSEERMRIVNANYIIGAKSGLDLKQATVDLNSDRSQLMKQYEVMHTMRTQLNRLMGVEDVDSPVVAADSIIEYDRSISYTGIAEKMFTENTYLELSRKGEDVAKLDLKLAESGKYPYMRVNTGYGYTHNWYGSGSFDKQRNLGLNYGVSVGINIFDGSNQKRKERNARIEIENSRLNYQKIELGLKKALSDAWMSYQNNIRLTELEVANLTVARDNFEAAMDKYQEGVLAGIELREAQNSLLSAEERVIQAEFDTKVSEITLLALSGEVFRYLE